MSYDLYLRPRQGDLPLDKVNDYFLGRPYYRAEKRQFWYDNPKTGVYFLFELQDPGDTDEEEFYPILFNLNFYRPSFFILEAEPEVTAFIQQFDLIVSDPQTHGMGQGEYQKELLITGWNHGNEFGYSSILQQPQSSPKPITLPTHRLHEIWNWNKHLDERQTSIGESKFVPQIMLLQVDGETVTASVWPDGIPILIPPVDYFIIRRKQLANRRLFRKVEDQTLLSMSKARSILERHAVSLPDQTQVLDFDNPPEDVVRFIKSLPSDNRTITGLAKDSVLDRELVAKYS